MDGTYKFQLCSTWHSRDSIDHISTVCCEKKAEIYRFIIYQLLACVSFWVCIYLHFRKRNTVSHKIVKNIFISFSENVGFTSHSQICLGYVTAHRCASGPKKVDLVLQSDFQSHAMRFYRSLSGAHPNQHRHILSVLLRLDPSIIQWDSNS